MTIEPEKTPAKPPRGQGRLLLRGSFLSFVSFSLDFAVAFFLMPFLIHSLGERSYGLWALVGTIVGQLGILDGGLMSTTQRFMANALARNDVEESKTIYSTSMAIFIAIGVLVFAVVALAALCAQIWLHSQNELNSFRWALSISGFNLAFLFPLAVMQGSLTSILRSDATSIARLVSTFARVVLAVTAIKLGYGIVGLAVANVVSSFCNRLIVGRMMRRYLPEIRFSLPYATLAKSKELFAFGKYILLMKISDGAQYRFDNLIIAPLAGLVAVTHYSVAIRLTDYFEAFVSSLFYSIGSVFARHATNNEDDELREKFLTLSRLGAVICCLFAAGSILFGWQFLRVWLGPDFRDTYYALCILSLSALATLIQGPARTLLQVIYKHGFDAKTNAVEVAINLVLTVILVRAYGIVGAAIGTAIPSLIVKGFVLPIYVCRRLAIDLKTYYWAIGTPILISTAIALPLMWIISRTAFQSLLAVIGASFIFAAVLLAILLRCLPKADRETLLHAIGKNNLSYIPGGSFIAHAVLG